MSFIHLADKGGKYSWKRKRRGKVREGEEGTGAQSYGSLLAILNKRGLVFHLLSHRFDCKADSEPHTQFTHKYTHTQSAARRTMSGHIRDQKLMPTQTDLLGH